MPFELAEPGSPSTGEVAGEAGAEVACSAAERADRRRQVSPQVLGIAVLAAQFLEHRISPVPALGALEPQENLVEELAADDRLTRALVESLLPPELADVEGVLEQILDLAARDR